MENIVFGLKKLHFMQNTAESLIFTEHRFCDNTSATPQVAGIDTDTKHVDSGLMHDTSEAADDNANDDGGGGSSDIDACYDTPSTSTKSVKRGGVCLRRMPTRTSKDAYKTIRSTAMKPKKRNVGEFKVGQTMAELKKIYAVKKVKKFSPSSLETIFEESESETPETAEDDISKQVRLIKFGQRKMRRSISFGDGLNTNKTLIKRRRAKIKKTFGRRFALKKISITEFHERLNKSFDGSIADIDDDDDDDVVSDFDHIIEDEQISMASEVPPVVVRSTEFLDADMGVLVKSKSFSGVCNDATN